MDIGGCALPAVKKDGVSSAEGHCQGLGCMQGWGCTCSFKGCKGYVNSLKPSPLFGFHLVWHWPTEPISQSCKSLSVCVPT